ncbi:MAG: hypothetical protein ABFC96_18620 [Thermoguttaceae bacterium]
MRRLVLMLGAVTVICVAARAVQAHDHWGCGPYRPVYRPVVRTPIVVTPRVVVPARMAPPPVAYPPPVYGYYPYVAPRPCYYAPAPACGVYFRTRGLSLGVGF